MTIIEYLKSLFWTPPPMPAYKLPLMARLAGVEHIIKEVGEHFYAEGFKDGWIAATAAYAFLIGLYLLFSRRTDATTR